MVAPRERRRERIVRIEAKMGDGDDDSSEGKYSYERSDDVSTKKFSC